MKKIILIIFFGLVFLTNLKSNPCALSSNCLKEEFQYNFCLDGTLFTRCSSEPYNEYGGSGAQKITPLTYAACTQYANNYKIIMKDTTIEKDEVVKHDTAIDNDDNGDIYGYYDGDSVFHPNTDTPFDMDAYSLEDPIYFPYDTHEWSETTTTVPGNEYYKDFWKTICFDYQAIGGDITNALNAWTSICTGCPPLTPNNNNCCLKIKWTASDDFTWRHYSPDSVPAFTKRLYDNNCNPICDSVFTELNQTQDFTQAPDDALWDYNMFYITGNVSKSTLSAGSWYSLTAIITHEIGHYLGFADQNSACPCPHNGSIMNNGFNGNGYDFTSSDNIKLNSDDSCMYRKLYCAPASTCVQEQITINFGIKLYPNPTDKDLINLQFGNPDGKLMSFEIVSQLGNSVLSGNILPNENPKTIVLDNLSSGVYFIILKHDGTQETQKFVINK